MINYNDLKPGVVFILDNEPYQVIEFNFMRMQQRKPVAQTKIRNLITGKVISRNFQHTESFEQAKIDYKKAKFLYGHRGKFVFSEITDPSKRFELGEEQVGDSSKFLKSNCEVDLMEFEEKIINIVLPIKMDFKVIEAPPGVRGNTAQGGIKAVKIETGAMINTPLFIEQGDIIEINTRTGEYVERVKQK